MSRIESGEIVLVSSCLAGIKRNYKGDASPCEKIIDLVKTNKAIPMCPEECGDLPSPFYAAEKVGDRVLTINGIDVTDEFNEGARKVLAFALENGIKRAVLKSKSPSCGRGKIYDGTFTGRLVEGNGVLTELLLQNGIEVLSEDEV